MEENINEEWRDIIGYEGLYQVSNLGRIKSLERYRNGMNGCKILVKEKIMKTDKNCWGYLRITLRSNNVVKRYSVHRLVALVFIPNPNNFPEINHIDEDKTNNRVENLEWCDKKYNINYGGRTKNAISKFTKTVLQLDLKGNIINEFPSTMEAERQTGFNHSEISNCCNRKRKTCGGFIWKYKTKNGEE